MLTWETLVLIGLTAAGAALLFFHLLLVLKTVTSDRLAPAMRLLSLLPPLSPILAWRAGAHALVVFWLLSAAIYFSLLTLT